jgi:predicted GIY-YIG superfamily endonuclease
MERKPNGYWTKERCVEEALKYKKRSEFHKKSQGAYFSARKNGWLDEICLHMGVFGNILMRCIYVFEFSDNYAYVGLTRHLKSRYNEHIKNIDGVVYKHMEETGLKPKYIQLTDFMDEKEASIKEGEWEKIYKSNGWIILNIAKTGTLGGCYLKWNYKSCKKEALKYQTRSEFQKNSNGAYCSARKNGWLDEVCKDMIEDKKPNGYWTKEKCTEEASKYNSRTSFSDNCVSAYGVSRKNNWLDEFFPKNK